MQQENQRWLITTKEVEEEAQAVEEVAEAEDKEEIQIQVLVLSIILIGIILTKKRNQVCSTNSWQATNNKLCHSQGSNHTLHSKNLQEWRRCSEIPEGWSKS